MLDPYWLDDIVPEKDLSKSELEALRGEFGLDEWEDSAVVYLPRDENSRREVALPDPPLVLDFDLFARRVAAQRSRFLTFGTDPDWLRDRIGKKDNRLVPIRISGAAVARLQDELRTCGITESVIFPDLDGLGREISALWERLVS